MEVKEDKFERLFIKNLQTMVPKCHANMTGDEIMGFCCDLIKKYDKNLKIDVSFNHDPDDKSLAYYNYNTQCITLFKDKMLENCPDTFICCVNTTIHECRHAHQDNFRFVTLCPQQKMELAKISASRGYIKDRNLSIKVMSLAKVLRHSLYRADADEIEARAYADKISEKFVTMLKEYNNSTGKLGEEFVTLAATGHSTECMKQNLDEILAMRTSMGMDSVLINTLKDESDNLFSPPTRKLERNNFGVINFLGALAPFAPTEVVDMVKTYAKYNLFGHASLLNFSHANEDVIYSSLMECGYMDEIKLAVKQLAYSSAYHLNNFVEKYVDNAPNDKVRSKTLRIIDREITKANKFEEK